MSNCEYGGQTIRTGKEMNIANALFVGGILMACYLIRKMFRYFFGNRMFICFNSCLRALHVWMVNSNYSIGQGTHQLYRPEQSFF